MSTGFVPLFRWIRDDPDWKKKPFSRLEAKLDLLMEATFKNKRKIEIRGRYLMLTRGQLLVSKWELSRRWGWGRKKVNRFLKSLARFKGEPWAIEENTIRASVPNPKEKPAAIGTMITFINFERLVAELENDENNDYTF